MAVIPGAYTATNVLKNPPIAQNVGPPGPQGPAGSPGATYIPIAFNVTNDVEAELVAGSFIIDPTDPTIANRTLSFVFTGFVSLSPPISMTVYVYDITESPAVQLFSHTGFESVTPVVWTSDAIPMPVSPQTIEIRILFNSGGETGTCTLSNVFLKAV